jgi:hypothetical protein
MRAIRETAIALALTLVACADVNSVVGGACAEGYVQQGDTCVVPTSTTNPNGNDAGAPNGDDGSAPNNGSDGSTASNNDAGTTNGNDASTQPPNNVALGPQCTLPDLSCGNVCIDPSSDPDNCGSCGHVCPSNLCVAGKCEGSAPGHVVVIGHDYETAPTTFSSQARVLTNATLLPASNPLRVMSYEEYSDAKAVSNAESVVGAEAKQLGRTVTFTATTSDTAVSSAINIDDYDVLVVQDQMNAPSGTLAQIGSAWATDGHIATFLHAGGVVVVLSGGTGIGEMPALATNASLLTVNSQTAITGSLEVLAPADAIGAGVVSPYAPKANTVSFDTEANGGDVVWVVAQNGAPVVIHKVMP